MCSTEIFLIEGGYLAKHVCSFLFISAENGASLKRAPRRLRWYADVYILNAMGLGGCRFTLGEKIAIVQEAYELPGKVCQVGKKHGIDYRNIKKWRKR
jgi:hypothetical protein